MLYQTYLESDLSDQFERMRRQMDSLFGAWPSISSIRAAAAGSFPATNVGASAERVDVYIFAAGIDPNSLDIQLQQNLLTFSGKRELKSQENATCYLSERFNGEFRRVLTLPEDIDSEKVEASYRDGVLHVIVQRREAVKPRQIQVK
ncbi:Heat shock protein Hsp20 [Candidatus Methylobacter favarea]|uniref:Heat shock protein Hsp20 n=1 Tax=Candidatus Methylobacter favarea TaxID=2707345 RepID=A0A8S0W8E4_9GAMM|nr:Hsp20/alpha crystallin family protein [Candidatus Methylobacter favarea]CAA9889229.1 Heat shock protein Hsp20 [Candidatus Methylobacter favarea]